MKNYCISQFFCTTIKAFLSHCYGLYSVCFCQLIKSYYGSSMNNDFLATRELVLVAAKFAP